MKQPTQQEKRRAILMIVVFTFFAAVAQPLFKIGANRLFHNLTISGFLTDVPLLAGLALYGLGSALMILALRHGELSVLYPFISLSYVWVAVLSVAIFREHMDAVKILGMLSIIGGVVLLGRAGGARS